MEAAADKLLRKHIPAVLSRSVPLDARSAWLGHVPFARWIVAAQRPEVLVELGTHAGASYFALCQAIVDERVQGACIAVDTWEGDDHAGKYGEDIYEEFLEKNAAFDHFSTPLRMTFDEALDRVADNSVDLLHIDGLHTLEASTHDFESWRPKLSERAVVLFHDIAEAKDDFGVWILWDQLQQEFPSFAFSHEHGLGVLGVGKQLAPDLEHLFALTGEAADAFRAAFETVGIPIAENADHARRARAQKDRVANLDRQLNEVRSRLGDAQASISNLERERRHLRRVVAEMHASTTWRLGSLLLAPVRGLRGFRNRAL